MVPEQRSDTSEMEQAFAISQLRREEQMLFLPLGLTLFAVFSLGYAVWDYTIGHHDFALMLTAAGAASVVMLILFQTGGKKVLPLVRFSFGLLIVLMIYVFLMFCTVGQTGMIGALCMVPGLVAICGNRVGGWTLLVNFLVIAALYMGWLPWQVKTFSNEMWIGFLGAFAGMGIFICTMDYFRDRSRSQLVAMTRQFNRVASLDQLTELPNRREMERLLGGSLNRYHLAGEAYSIIIADIDSCKHFNDRFGHQFGDKLMKAVSGALQQGLRSDDIVARWGGDEFLVMLRGQKVEAAQQVAERLRRNVASLRLKVSGEEIGVTMSFGVACVEGHDNGDDLLSSADRGLYQAKHMGRDMVVVG